MVVRVISCDWIQLETFLLLWWREIIQGKSTNIEHELKPLTQRTRKKILFLGHAKSKNPADLQRTSRGGHCR